MGLMLLLKFALVCIDYLAWPVIALGYPLFASIRAVETDSKYHMKKLITYWTLFSLISLFEFAFLKFLVWIPFWDSIRLIAVIWLVIPRFQGAFHAYQILVRPLLSMDLPAVMDKLYKTNEDKHLRKATLLEETKLECSKPEREVLGFEPEKKNDIATSEQVQRVETSDRPPEIPPVKNPWTCDICNVTTTSETTLNAHLQGSTHRSNCESLKRSKLHAEDTRSSSSGDRPTGIPPIKNSRQEWTCDICKVTTTSETTLKAHIQGSKHRSNCESLKGTKFHAADARSSSSSDGPLEIPPIRKSQQGWNCDICKVTTTSETTLNAHLQGSKHRFNCESMKGSKLPAGDTRPSSSRSNQGSRLKQVKPKQGVGTNQISKLYCNICSLKLNSNIDLASHVKGKRHISNITTIPSVN